MLSRLTAALRTSAALVLVLAAGAFISTVSANRASDAAARFSALAVNPVGPGTSTVEIVVERWSTDADRDMLLSTLLSRGPDKLLDALQSTEKVGFIRSPGNIGWDLHYARRTPLAEGGERVVVATDRPVGFWESPGLMAYPFTVIELRLNPKGEGEGQLSIAAKISVDKETGTIVIENWGIQPVQLQAVKRETAS